MESWNWPIKTESIVKTRNIAEFDIILLKCCFRVEEQFLKKWTHHHRLCVNWCLQIHKNTAWSNHNMPELSEPAVFSSICQLLLALILLLLLVPTRQDLCGSGITAGFPCLKTSWILNLDSHKSITNVTDIRLCFYSSDKNLFQWNYTVLNPKFYFSAKEK